ncbi:MAG: spore cortex biosynthesis protein YabQ [Cellulosilyticaceae bacterium]
MNEMVNVQTLLFIKAIEIGIIMGMIYDIIRIIRKIVIHPNWLVQAEDALYWISCIGIGFTALYIHNFAEIRVFVFIGMILGAILYFATVSIIFMKVATWIINLMRKIISELIRILSIPLRFIIRLLSIPAMHIKKLIVKVKKFIYYKFRQSKRKLQYVESDFKTHIYMKQNKNIYKRKKTR